MYLPGFEAVLRRGSPIRGVSFLSSPPLGTPSSWSPPAERDTIMQNEAKIICTINPAKKNAEFIVQIILFPFCTIST